MSQDPERYRALRQLFDAAVSLPPDARAMFVRDRAIDPAMAAELAELLATSPPEADLVLQCTKPTDPVLPPPPEQIGPYRIVRSLGRGGMGEVYLAEQSAPVRRHVALKLVKSGLDSRGVVARFEHERQALALMQHDGIARVFECGASVLGQPYFVMEWVQDAEPLGAYCEKRRLPLPARIELILQVCAAVAHAHQKGVVHRDLKPGNVLVHEQGGVSRVKVIDFGLAKAIGPDLQGRPDLTAYGQILGTPEYMAPEQADPGNADIDTRADVYALGVMLFEQACGELPFASGDLRGKGLTNLQRLLRDVEPGPPSRRLGPSGASVASARGESLPSLLRGLRGGLDWIVGRAMAKDREDRYPSVIALADDLQRFVAHEPLVARPPSAGHRVRLFVRRNRGRVVAAAAMFVAMLAGGVVAFVNWRQAEENLLRYRETSTQIELDNLLVAAEDLSETPSALDKLVAAAEAAEGLLAALPAAATLQRGAAAAAALAELERGAEWQEWREAAVVKRTEFEQMATSGGVVPPGALELLSKWIARADRALVSDAAAPVGVADWFRAKVTTLRNRVQAAQEALRLAAQHDDTWSMATASIAQSSVYSGLELVPQHGLVPLGPDPVSGLWEFGHPRSGALPVRDGAGRLVVSPDTGLVFVLLPGGSFWQGASQQPGVFPHDPLAQQAEAPHRAQVAAFLLSKYEMTQAQWQRLADGSNPSHFRPDLGYQPPITLQHPVENVSWNECHRLLTRLGLQLPTESQWEYAARGGTSTPWYTGELRDTLYAAGPAVNLADGSVAGIYVAAQDWPDYQDGFPAHAPVDSFPPNPFGLHHMLGNVLEWCADWYADVPLLKRPGDGLARAYDRSSRVMRGGSFSQPAGQLRVSFRACGLPVIHQNNLGVRPARAIHR